MTTDRDALRVHADGLLDAGDPQGEAIQLALALEDMALADPRRAEAEQRLEDLTERFGHLWRAQLGVPAPGVDVGLVHGLPRELRGTFTAVLHALHRISSPISSLRVFSIFPGHLRQLADAAGFPELVDLELRHFSPTVGTELAAMFASPRCPALASLTLATVQPPLAKALAGITLPLRALRLAGDAQARVTVDDIATLLGPGVEVLELRNVVVGADGIDLIAERCPALKRLVLENASLDAYAATRLDKPAFARLERLHVGSNPLRPEGFATIAGARHLANVVDISFARADGPELPYGPKCLAAFVAALVWKQVLALDLSHNKFHDLAALASKKLVTLRRLALRGNAFGDAGAQVLARLRLPSLRALDLDETGLRAGAMRVLAKAPWVADLEELSLRDNDFDDAAGTALGAASLANLRVLRIGACDLGEAGWRAILRSAPALRVLDANLSASNWNVTVEAFLSGMMPLRALHTPDLAPALLDELVASPRLASLASLRLTGAFDDARAAALVANPHAAGIGRLEVRGSLTAVGRAQLTARYGAHVVFLDEPR